MSDLRAWLGEIEKLGRLKKIDGLSRDLELSTFTEVRDKLSPA